MVETRIRPDSCTFVRAVRGQPTAVPPTWLMRQAGRYLPEYREVRAKHSFLEVCHTPELACEVTLQPIRRYGFDAAILFSDILVPLEAMGAELAFEPGPVINNPLRTQSDLERVRSFDADEDLPQVLEAVKLLRRELPEETALIGFAGAPFTLASYWVEGGKPQPFATVKRMMYSETGVFTRFLDRLGQMVADYLVAQAEAGADTVQLFDTWAGTLTEHDFRTYLAPSLQTIFSTLRQAGVPSTYYARGSNHLVKAIGELGADVVSLDWRTPIDAARRVLGDRVVLQGNLDPTVLLADERTIRRETRRILDEVQGRPHVFNLGHGILKMTPCESVEIMLDEIRAGGQG